MSKQFYFKKFSLAQIRSLNAKIVLFQVIQLIAFIGHSYISIEKRSIKMDELNMHILTVILWEFKNNKNVTETVKKISTIHSKRVITNN